jgi:hypothetical protein
MAEKVPVIINKRVCRSGYKRLSMGQEHSDQLSPYFVFIARQGKRDALSERTGNALVPLDFVS